MCKALSYAETLIDTLTEIKELYEGNEKNIIDCSNEEQDLLHEIELSNFNAARGCYLSKEIQRVRNERRKAKDENVTLKLLYDYLLKYDGMVKELQSIRGAIKREQEKLNTRLYKPRIRNDLTIPVLDIGGTYDKRKTQ